MSTNLYSSSCHSSWCNLQEQLRYLKENTQRAEPGSVEEIIKDIGHLRASVRQVKEDYNRFLRTRTRAWDGLIKQLQERVRRHGSAAPKSAGSCCCGSSYLEETPPFASDLMTPNISKLDSGKFFELRAGKKGEEMMTFYAQQDVGD